MKNDKPNLNEENETNGRDPLTGRFIVANKFWLKRTKHGPNLLMESPAKLQDACLEYFEDVVNNPFCSKKISKIKDNRTTEDHSEKMRIMSIGGLCLYLGISRKTWAAWRDRSDLSPVTSWADEVIREYQLSGATAGLLNPSIIAQLLGLVKRLDHGSKDGSMAPAGNCFDDVVKNAMAKAKEIKEES